MVLSDVLMVVFGFVSGFIGYKGLHVGSFAPLAALFTAAGVVLTIIEVPDRVGYFAVAHLAAFLVGVAFMFVGYGIGRWIGASTSKQ